MPSLTAPYCGRVPPESRRSPSDRNQRATARLQETPARLAPCPREWAGRVAVGEGQRLAIWGATWAELSTETPETDKWQGEGQPGHGFNRSAPFPG